MTHQKFSFFGNLKKLLIGLTVLTAFSISNASATVEVVETGSVVTGLTGLEFNGEVWNVTFSDVFDDSQLSIPEFNYALATEALALSFMTGGDLDGTPFDLSTNSFGCNLDQCRYVIFGEQIISGTLGAREYGLADNILFRFDSFESFSNGNSTTESDYFDGSLNLFGDNSQTLANFSLASSVAAVPEPSSYAMFGIGLGLLAMRRRKNTIS